ncbi:MBL fold metallo-hydrolase [Bosea sp. LjRoot237]|uniref:MBL fold metallo-hydrolase n=1 Tax=Bosea sp. LjRoot237 TaxID=3342292 RepID=UPI003ED076DB
MNAKSIEITQVRNATMVIDYAGVRFLIDPMLAEKGAYPGFPGTLNEELRNPLVPLPLAQIIDVDAVLVTHLHLDHWDEAAAQALPKSLPVLVPCEADADEIRKAGFTDVRVIGAATAFKGVTLTRTSAVHGVEAVVQAFPPEFLRVGGAVFSHPGHKTLYLAADTVWYEKVQEAIAAHSPDVIVLNSGNAQAAGLGRLIMNASDVLEVHRAAPSAMLIDTHMEAVNHCTLTRSALRSFAEQQGFSDRLRLPADGERITV